MSLSNIDLFKSRKFWSALLSLIFMVVVAFVPDLESHAAQLIDAALIVVSLVIGGFAIQDGAQAFVTGKTKYDRAAPAEDAGSAPIKSTTPPEIGEHG